MVDVTIVGGGLAGLISANLLAKAGKSVTVFERGRVLGGRARTDDERGYKFNLGPHALYKNGEAARILKEELDVIPAGKIAPANGALLLRGDQIHLLPGALGSLLQTRPLGVAAKLEIARAFAQLPTLDPLPLQSISLNHWLASWFRKEESRQLMRAIFRVSTYANHPDLQSASAAIQQLQCGLAGVYYLDGGWQSMVDSLHSGAVERGVEIIRSTRVESVYCDGGKARGVCTSDGARYLSEATILATPPAEASKMLANLPQHPIHRYANEVVPVQAACLSVGLRSLPKPKNRFLLGMDAPLYYSVHSLTARLAPEGGSVIQLARYLGLEGEPSPDETRSTLEGLLDRLQPGWRAEVVIEQYLPRMTVVPALDLATAGGLIGRADVHLPGLDDLYLAGDWVGAEGMLADASVASAARCAKEILRSQGSSKRRYEALQNVTDV